MTQPHDKTSDELISAYLDGELDAQQRAEAEQLMARDPHYSRMLEELRTLRETLRSLPRHQLDAGFHARVLRKAQEQMTADAQLVPASQEVQAATRPARGFSRGLVWAAAVVAAAVLLTVFVPESRKKGVGPIAQAPPEVRAPASVASREEARPPAELRRALDRPEGLTRGAVTAAKLDEENSLKLEGAESETKWGEPIRAKAAAPSEELADQPMDRAAGLGQTRDLNEQLRSPQPAAPSAMMPSIAETAPAAGDAFARSAQTEGQPVAGQPAQPDADALLADAVIHVRWNEADNDQSAEDRLNANLVRNQVAVLRQEPAAMNVAAKPDAPARDLSLYFRNQAAVDLGVVENKPDGEPVQLWLVEAPVGQIAAAVDQLQQEGGAVLATVTGPRQAGADRRFERRDDSQFGAAERDSAITAGKSGLGGAGRMPAGERGEVELLEQTVQDEHSAAADGSKELEAPSQQAQSPAAVPSPNGVIAGEAATQRQRYAYAVPLESRGGAQVLAASGALQQQLQDLAAGAAGRPLQVLIVLHGPPSAAAASSVEPAAEPASEAAPSEPR